MKIEVLEGFPEIEIIIKCPEKSDEVNKITEALRIFDEKLSGTKNGWTHMIEKRDVFYFESVDKRCFLYTAEDTYEISAKLYEIEERLSNTGFFRSSKSQIINIAKIEALCPDFGGRFEATMENGEKLIISRQYTRALKERLGIK